jgi:hypothetical protein
MATDPCGEFGLEVVVGAQREDRLHGASVAGLPVFGTVFVELRQLV